MSLDAEFQAAVREVAGAALANGGDAAKALHSKSSQGNTIGEMLVGLVAKIGENIKVRRFARFRIGED